MSNQRAMVYGVLIGFAIGWAVFDGAPIFTPRRPDRPVLRWLANAAKTALWLMAFAEPAPPDSEHYTQSVHLTPDGAQAIDHSRAF